MLRRPGPPIWLGLIVFHGWLAVDLLLLLGGLLTVVLSVMFVFQLGSFASGEQWTSGPRLLVGPLVIGAGVALRAGLRVVARRFGYPVLRFGAPRFEILDAFWGTLFPGGPRDS
jgi:hypothetical protein